MTKGPKHMHHLTFLTDMEKLMLKRHELREILESQVVQELDSDGKPTKTFDCEL